MHMGKEVPRSRLALWIGLLAIVSGCAGEAPPVKRPNVLLISIDTLRKDALSAYGNEFPTSPSLDALAARGVLFEDATSTTSWTLPAHISMLTGLSISAHGICDERLWSPGGPQELALRGEFLSESLGRAGYVSGGFFTWKYLDRSFGFGPGFETWRRVSDTVWTDGPDRERFLRLKAGDRHAELAAWAEEEPERFDLQAPTAQLVVDAGLEWLDQRDEQPFFLFLHLFDVHDDYVPPAPYDTAFDPDYTGPIDGTKVSTQDSPIDSELPAEDLAHLAALYLGEVAWVDAQLGRLFDELEKRGLTEDTLIVVTSDHGEEFFEHGNKTHRTQLFRESTDVPLIVSWPGHLPEGKRVEGPVGIVDIAPTISALVDVAPPASVSGRDLSGVLRGEEPNAEATYLSELMLFEQGSRMPQRQTALRRGMEHFIRIIDRDGRVHGTYFDRSQNPLEVGPGRTFETDSPELARFEALLSPVRIATQSERDAAPPRTELFTELTSADAEELAAMGYVGGVEHVVMTDSSLLCLDGCFTVVPTPPLIDSQ